jgi:hypothetical protein
MTALAALGTLAAVPLRIGTAGLDQRVWAGVLVFGFVTLALGYLSFVRREFGAGIVLKAGTVLLFVLTLLSYFWPSRPWPH